MPVLTVHDCVVTTADCAAYAGAVLREEFARRTKLAPTVKRDEFAGPPQADPPAALVARYIADNGGRARISGSLAAKFAGRKDRHAGNRLLERLVQGHVIRVVEAAGPGSAGFYECGPNAWVGAHQVWQLPPPQRSGIAHFQNDAICTEPIPR